jgi:hypothetical protein
MAGGQGVSKMTEFDVTIQNEQIAANLKATLEASDATLISTLKSSLSSPVQVEPEPPKTSNLGAFNIGLFRERLRNPISKTG